MILEIKKENAFKFDYHKYLLQKKKRNKTRKTKT